MWLFSAFLFHRICCSESPALIDNTHSNQFNLVHKRNSGTGFRKIDSLSLLKSYNLIVSFIFMFGFERSLWILSNSGPCRYRKLLSVENSSTYKIDMFFILSNLSTSYFGIDSNFKIMQHSGTESNKIYVVYTLIFCDRIHLNHMIFRNIKNQNRYTCNAT